MSEFESYEVKPRSGLAPLESNDWTTSAEVRWDGVAYTESLPSPANANITEMHVRMTVQLPEEIQGAIREWATHLRTLPWNLRRRAIKRFAGSFADNFLATIPTLSDEEYDSLSDIGTTCILEQLDDGGPMQDAHQARCYLDSVHEHHQAMAQTYLARIRPKVATLH
jgi:hypothetical protein